MCHMPRDDGTFGERVVDAYHARAGRWPGDYAQIQVLRRMGPAEYVQLLERLEGRPNTLGIPQLTPDDVAQRMLSAPTWGGLPDEFWSDMATLFIAGG